MERKQYIVVLCHNGDIHVRGTFLDEKDAQHKASDLFGMMLSSVLYGCIDLETGLSIETSFTDKYMSCEYNGCEYFTIEIFETDLPK